MADHRHGECIAVSSPAESPARGSWLRPKSGNTLWTDRDSASIIDGDLGLRAQAGGSGRMGCTVAFGKFMRECDHPDTPPSVRCRTQGPTSSSSGLPGSAMHGRVSSTWKLALREALERARRTRGVQGRDEVGLKRIGRTLAIQKEVGRGKPGCQGPVAP